uniref:Hexosyltransferase n=1 Tax=Bursaphelenchus xylophilus TaxID=6326 RepID=A0A1I7SAL0_BURXY
MLSSQRPCRIFRRRDGLSRQIVCTLLLFNTLFWLFILRRSIQHCQQRRAATPPFHTRPPEQLYGTDFDKFNMTLKGFRFEYKMTSPKRKNCVNTTIFLAIMSTGDKAMHVQREALRNTYLSKAAYYNIEYKFFIGKSNTTRPDLLQKEVKQYNDIVFIDMVDSYANNSIKWNAMYQYHQSFCHEAFFFMKVDDDVIVHFPRLWQWIERDFGGIIIGQRDWLVCQKIQGVQPIRDPNNKWFVPKHQFEKDWYPPYCNGYAVIMPSETVGKLLEEAKHHQFMKMDDVFFTGILTEPLNITVNHFIGIGGDFEIDICRGDPPFQTVIHSERRPKTIYAKYYKLEKCAVIAKQLGDATVIPHVDYEG